jgi:tetratricopeptide (TPR) repeat protein
MKLGAKDSTRFQEAVEEAARYISDHTNGYALPRATKAKARALWLTGKATEAADTYNALFGKFGAKAAGYPMVLCLDSGLQAGWAALDADDTGKARTYFTAAQTAIEAALPEALPADTAQLENWAATASVGEGFCLLKSGDSRGARSFFERKQSSTSLAASGVFAATLGLGEALLASGEAAEAQVHLARVSALDPSGRDRTARALLGLAKCMKALGDPKSDTQASILLAKVKGAYGDTPAAVEAAKVN